MPDETNDYDISMNVTTHVFGMPGEELQVFLMDKGAPAGQPALTSKEFDVEVILARPNHVSERSQYQGFQTNLDGNSYIRLAKPRSERRPRDLAQLNLTIGAGTIQLLPNDQGYAGKLVFDTFHTESFEMAEQAAMAISSSFLAGWSTYLDTPLVIDQIRIKDPKTGRTFVRALADQWEVWLGRDGTLPVRDEEYTHYADLYREAISTSSSMYRFLSLYKLLEALQLRRSRRAEKQDVRIQTLIEERLPKTEADLPGFLKSAYPIPEIQGFDAIFLQQVWRSVVAGKKFNDVLFTTLRPVRDRIAHTLLSSGELGVGSHHANQDRFLRSWLPLLRCMARIRLRNEFPTQFIYQARAELVS